MNMLTIIDEYRAEHRELPSMLVSGVDQTIRECVSAKWFDMVSQTRVPHVVIDTSRLCTYKDILKRYGVSIGACLLGNAGFSMFDGDQMDREDRLRVHMGNAGWSESQKDKAISYLHLLQHFYELEYGKRGEINLELITMYSAPKVVEYKIQQLTNAGFIDIEEQVYILGRYSELSSIAPDLEHMIIGGASLSGVVSGKKINLNQLMGNRVLYVHLGKVKDINSRKNILEMVCGMVEDYVQNMRAVSKSDKPFVTIFSKGTGADHVTAEFAEEMCELSRMLFVSDNVFAIEHWEHLIQHFPMRLYSRHETMEACKKVEESFGNIYVRKKSYAMARDMHHKARGLLDRVMKTDVVMTETISDPVEEAKYRKEYIRSMEEGFCIMSYAGKDFLTRM